MGVRIGIGAGLERPLPPEDYFRWVDFCEAAGIDSIWHSERLIGPALEPLSMLAALAGRTRRMKFGTNALVLPFREPLLAAKQFASIDFLSGGRLFPVVGVGAATDPYWAATGADAKQRGRRSDEALALIRALLTQDEVDFTGRHFRYVGPGVQPRPKRAIPIWTGGNSDAAIRRTAALGDGWLGGLVSVGTAGEVRRKIEAGLRETGRRIEDDHYGVTLPLRIGRADDPAVTAARARFAAQLPEPELAEVFAIGEAAEIIAILRRYVDAGMSKFVVVPLAADAADLLAQTELLVRDILPAIEA